MSNLDKLNQHYIDMVNKYGISELDRSEYYDLYDKVVHQYALLKQKHKQVQGQLKGFKA